jgi:threonylcarbamoyladenosine tRNA methylthiotransferase MtaB
LHRSNIFKKDDLEAGGGLEPKHKRAFLKIQDGCNSFCTFCIIPYARGLSRSIPVSQLVTRANDLHAQGFMEIVLTGVHIGDYADGEKTLEDLISALLVKTKVDRIRLSSLEPIEISDRLLELYGDTRLCPHFHMSIQSANTEVLSQMKRKYGNAEVRDALLKISKKVPNVFVGMDVIAGFPTETEEQFLDTYQTLNELPWTRLHVFPYSERKGTKAATFEQLPLSVRKARASRLRDLSRERFESEALKQKGLIKSALIVGAPGKIQGVTRDYWTIKFDSSSQDKLVTRLNQETLIKITGYSPNQAQRLEGYLEGACL